MNYKAARTSQRKLQIDLSRHALIEYMVGPSSSGPSKCVKCHGAFKAGEPWRCLISPVDPQFGSYRVGVHTVCSLKARRNSSVGARPRPAFGEKGP